MNGSPGLAAITLHPYGTLKQPVISRVWLCREVALALLMALVLSGCATRQTLPNMPPGELSDCQNLFLDSDRDIARASVRDQGPLPIPGFPYLRVTRFLSSFRDEPMDTGQRAAWVAQMAALDASARRLELRNLEGAETTQISPALSKQLDHCRTILVSNLLQQPTHFERLRQQAAVPDDYISARRIAGLYPLSALFVSLGIKRWHSNAEKQFDLPLTEVPVRGQLIRWGHTTDRKSPSSLAFAERDPLGIPTLTTTQQQQLFRRHAPVWEIDVVDDNDMIGTPRWRNGPVIDTTQATQYQLLSYTRYENLILVQLNYVIWFKSRPGNDIYAGQIDGLTWRVTLGPNGEPWLYDSIHNCGCYHHFFPTQYLQQRHGDDGAEPPLVPQQAPSPPLVVRLESRRHFIQRVYHDTGTRPAQPLAQEQYNLLRALPTSQGHHSLFGRYGLVAGSQRLERFILWPMGIRSPGAMRQWGRHPVAFVGRRHFDDPRLIQALFQRVSP